jgi:uncharacterized protein YceK
MYMKRVWLGVAVLALLGGCTSVAEIEQSPETMSVMSGKKPKEYAACVMDKLQTSRKPSLLEPIHNGYRLIVPQKMSDGPAAVIFIEERSNGSSVKVHEHLSNFPLRFGDVRKAADECISG